mgnify:FL=1
MKGLPELVIGDLKVKRPVIQGGMGVGVSLGQLAGAVAKEGGVGIISTAQIGFREPDFETNTRAANIRAIGSEFQRARETAPDGVIGFNIMVALKDYDEHVKAAVDAGADLIVSGAGLPIELPGLVEGSSTKIAPIVSTEKSAKVILKYWDKKFSRTADLIVIEGPKAGGHLGFDREQLETYTQESYDNEIERIMAVVRKYAQKYQVHIPVAVAGGISDKDAAEHAFSLGADAVQAATRFVTTWECDADLSYKQSYLNAKKEDVILVKSPVGMPARAINNKFLKRVKKEGRIAPIKCHQCVSTCNMLETPYCITDALINAVSGNVDEGLIFCGAYAYKINDISTVKDIIKNYF